MKRFTVSLDQPFTAGELGTLHDVLPSMAGLTSNWPDLPAVPLKKPVSFFAIDVNGETICKAHDPALADDAAKRHGGSVRPVYLTDERRY